MHNETLAQARRAAERKSRVIIAGMNNLQTADIIFGTVEVTRTGYHTEDKPSLHPLDGALNLPPERYSLEVRRRVAIEAAKGAFDERVKTLEEFSGAHVPKRQFEELVLRAAQDFEAFYADRQNP